MKDNAEVEIPIDLAVDERERERDAQVEQEHPLLVIEDLIKRFDDHTVLDGINLTIHRGETVVIVGGSGSGKSTLARIVMGLEPATAGRIILDGVDLSTVSERERARARSRFAMVFQKYALLDSLSVFDNVAFPLRERHARHGEPAHLSESEISERVMEQLRVLGLEAAAEKLPGELSGGMAKRVGIARAMVMNPEILVYDEPTSGLDPVTSRVVDDLIEEVRERFCVTSIVISHDMATAFGIADRVVLLHGGKVAVDGPPQVVLTAHDARMEPFAVSSGIDPERIVPRAWRLSPREIRTKWRSLHRASAESPPIRQRPPETWEGAEVQP